MKRLIALFSLLMASFVVRGTDPPSSAPISPAPGRDTTPAIVGSLGCPPGRALHLGDAEGAVVEAGVEAAGAEGADKDA